MYRSGLNLLLILFSTCLFASQNPGYLGVSVKSDAVNATDGLRIINVYDDGAAWVAGLHENDLITHFNGKQVSQSSDFDRVLSAYQWGDIVNITYLRDNYSYDIDIILGYEVRTKTYEILKSEQLLGEVIWYFKDNTTIVMKDDEVLSITKKFENGEKETFELPTEKYEFVELPQRFRDLDDKVDVIRRTIIEQEENNTDADQITFVKEAVKDPSSDIIGIESMRTSEFNLFPNPSNGQFEVKLVTEEKGLLTWDIYDVRGSSVESGQYSDFDGTFNQLFNLPGKFKGTYLIYFRVGNKSLSQRLILQ